MTQDKYEKLLEFTPIYESLPEGWIINERATCHSRGYVWIHNNKSMFSKERRIGLMKVQREDI